MLDRDGRGLGCRPGRALRGIALELSLTGLPAAGRAAALGRYDAVHARDRVGAAGTGYDRVGASGTVWLPVSVDEFPQKRHVGWFWPADGQKDLGSLQLYLFAGLGKRAEPVFTRVPDGRMLGSFSCTGQQVSQFVVWIWSNPGLGTVGYYSDFLGWLALPCADAVLFQKQMKYGFSSGVQGPFGPQGYVV